MEVYDELEKALKEIERLKKSEKEALDTLESSTYENINLINEVDRLNNIINNPEDLTLCKMWADTKLKEEIERLNKCYCNRSDCGGRLNQKNEVYDSVVQRNEKAIEYIDRTIEIIKQQPSEDDTWILERLNGIKQCLKGSE